MKIVSRIKTNSTSSNFICFRNMTDLMIKDDVIAFIGPDETCLYEALVASAWNLPMISYVSSLLISRQRKNDAREL